MIELSRFAWKRKIRSLLRRGHGRVSHSDGHSVVRAKKKPVTYTTVPAGWPSSRWCSSWFEKLSSLNISGGAAVSDQRKEKSLQTQNGFGGIVQLGMAKPPTKAPFFYLVGVSYLRSIKIEPMIREVSHRFIGSASLRLAL